MPFQVSSVEFKLNNQIILPIQKPRAKAQAGGPDAAQFLTVAEVYFWYQKMGEGGGGGKDRNLNIEFKIFFSKISTSKYSF